MSEPFLGEIKLVAWNFPARGWAFCNGQILAINQNQALFALLGTTFGGNGQTTFALPNLQGRVPVHAGNGHVLGEVGGQTAHTITQAELPSHQHTVGASSQPGDHAAPANDEVLGSPLNQTYRAADGALQPMVAGTVAGGAPQPHENMQPYLTLNYCIALVGVFPSRD